MPVDVLDDRPIEAARQREVPALTQAQRVGGVDAERTRLALEIDARVERLSVTVTAGDAIRERARPSDAAIGIEIPQLRD